MWSRPLCAKYEKYVRFEDAIKVFNSFADWKSIEELNELHDEIESGRLFVDQEDDHGKMIVVMGPSEYWKKYEYGEDKFYTYPTKDMEAGDYIRMISYSGTQIEFQSRSKEHGSLICISTDDRGVECKDEYFNTYMACPEISADEAMDLEASED